MSTWKTELHCDDCGATITFMDEKPQWQTDQELQRIYAEAAAYVEQRNDKKAENAGKLYSVFDKHPPYVMYNQMSGRFSVAHPPECSFIPCPCCDGKVFKDSWNQPA